MATRVQVPMKPATTPTRRLSPAPVGLLQRKCSCGGSAGSGGVCAECQKKKLQRSAAGGAPETAPPIVHEVLRSPGQPLDRQTRSFFEPRFGHDFSKVRVHTDARANESARAVNALAYTVGREVVFGRDQCSPSTPAGRKLIAHELAHVLQQDFSDVRNNPQAALGSIGDQYEREADHAASLVSDSGLAPRGGAAVTEGSPLQVQRRGPAIQRQALTCFVQPVRDECDAATGRCASVADDCKNKFPNPGDLDKYIATLKANFASSDFGPNAKKNFGHWLDGTGTELVMPTSLFEGHEATKDTLMVHRGKVLEGVQKRLTDGRIVPGVLSEMIPYTGHGNAFSLSSPHSDDLAFSVGGFQLCSNVRVLTTKIAPDRTKVQFMEWKCQGFDCYNWDPGKGIGIGGLDDTSLCCVENAGKAKHFVDRTDPWDNKDAASMADAEVGAGAPPPSATRKPEDDRR
jgi:Domain of unknown function (DUF4157)